CRTVPNQCKLSKFIGYSQEMVRSDGHIITGGVLSSTFTSTIQVFELPEASVTRKATMTVVPNSSQQKSTYGPKTLGRSPHASVIFATSYKTISQLSVLPLSMDSGKRRAEVPLLLKDIFVNCSQIANGALSSITLTIVVQV